MMAELQRPAEDRAGFWQTFVACAGTARDRHNRKRFKGWLFLWALSFLGATWLLKTQEGLAAGIAWPVAVLPNLFSVLALTAYLRFLREADELVRRIQLEGLAFAFGAGVIFAMAWFTLERVGVPELAGDQVLFVMMMAWITGQLVAAWRYR